MHRQTSQRGGSLFEVLVSVLILGLGILGVAAVQTAALRNARHALELSQAQYQGQAMVETMRSHRLEALAGAYHSGGFVCDAQAGAEIGRWVGHLKNILGETACAEIACPAGVIWCKLSIRWGAEAGDEAHELSTGVRL